MQFDAEIGQLTVDQIHQRLDTAPPVHWPCGAREEERRWKRPVSQLQPMRVNFRRLPSQSLSASQMLDVLPPMLVVNSTQWLVQLCGSDGSTTVVHANHVAVAPTLTPRVTIAFQHDSHWYHTASICLFGSATAAGGHSQVYKILISSYKFQCVHFKTSLQFRSTSFVAM